MSTTKKALQAVIALAFLVALFALALGEIVPHPEDIAFKLTQTTVVNPNQNTPNPGASIGNVAPEKATYNGPVNQPDGAYRSGGEDCASATVISSIPFTDASSTAGAVDDYEEECTYSSTSPDVVYVYSPASDITVDIALCNSSYDTKVFVYEDACSGYNSGVFYACNDDACGDDGYKSKIAGVTLYAGHDYYIVVDGYGGDYGDYILEITEPTECVVECPPGATMESEACGDDTNGGCNMTTTPTWEPISCGESVCGTIWADGGTRDTDWYEVTVTSSGTLTWTCEAEFDVVIGYIAGCPDGAPDCGCITQLDPYATGGCNDVISVSVDAIPGTYWFFVSHQAYEGQPCGFQNDYVVTLDCGAPPTGRCCYGDPGAPDCVEDITYDDCYATYGDAYAWEAGEVCPCPVASDNDDCFGAIEVFPPQEVVGTTVGATVDCPGVLDWNAVWYKFDNPYSCANVVIDACNVSQPYDVQCLGVVLYAACDDCPNYILYTGIDWVDGSLCGGMPSSQPIVYHDMLAGGTYYYPVFRGDADCNNIESDFSFMITMDECPPAQPGDNCDDPLAITLPADLTYMDENQYTCGRTDNYDGTCLGYYDGGEDIHYEVTVTEPVDVDIVLDAHSWTYSGILVDYTCPADPTTCIATSTNSGSGQQIISGLHLEAGTYYIMVDTWPSPDCMADFDLIIQPSAGPQEGEDCGYPVEVKIPTDLPYADLSRSNCTLGDDYSETCLGYYDGGEDIIYEVTVTATSVVTITMDPKGTTYSGLVIDDACPPDPSDCISYVTGSSGDPKVISDLMLDPGVYYIMVDTWPSPNCIPDFDLTIEQGLDPGYLTVSPTSFDFGTVNEGDAGSDILTLENTGQMDVNFDVTISYTSPTPPEIDGATITTADTYSAGATMDITFVLTNDSQDAEWLDDATITFPAGVTVNSATDFVVTTNTSHYLTYDGTTGDNVTVDWFDDNGGYGNIWSTESAEATVNITFDGSLSGDLALDYTISGDDWGGDPHDVSGTVILAEGTAPDPTVNWLTVTPTSGTVPGNPMATTDLTVAWDATGLYNETYEATIIITHDGSNGPTIMVPVTLTVVNGDVKCSIEPDPSYIYYQFAFDPIMHSVFVGNFNPGYGAANVASVTIAGEAGTFVATHTSYPGFTGEVAEFSFPVAALLQTYGAPIGLVKKTFTVDGTFDDASAFTGHGKLSVYGKTGPPLNRWITPEDEVVVSGDVDANGYLDIDDAVGIITYIFGGGNAPRPILVGDTNCSGQVDIDDVVYMITYIFGGGPQPCIM